VTAEWFHGSTVRVKTQRAYDARVSLAFGRPPWASLNLVRPSDLAENMCCGEQLYADR
jgi:hypothetical protein